MSDQILTLHVGPSQLLSKLCDEIELEKTINNLVKWDAYSARKFFHFVIFLKEFSPSL
ncbi:transposase family protein [Heyndrickxia coagulans]|uniref:Transposase family protein n=1 Tax=Heyndrickxia coagulans TaxID=1398 RepID=A0AAN0WAZ9_HEYCO|nr:transposase family protein [Heyndrickxia coagulans]